MSPWNCELNQHWLEKFMEERIWKIMWKIQLKLILKNISTQLLIELYVWRDVEDGEKAKAEKKPTKRLKKLHD